MRSTRRFWKSPTTIGPASRISAETLAETARHLRNIQFYFVLVCLGLLLAVYLPRDTALDKAASQLDEVVRFQSEVGDQPLWKIAGMAPPDWSGPREPLAAILFRRSPAESDKQQVCFVYDNEILRGSWLMLDYEGMTDFRHVETHEQFVRLWDTLASEDAFLRVRKYAESAYFLQGGSNQLNTTQPVPVQLVTDATEVQRLYHEAFSLAGGNNLSPSIADWVELEEEIQGQPYTRGIQLLRSHRLIGGPDALILPVAVEPARLPMLKRLLDRTDVSFEHLSANHYSLVHNELADWTLSGELDQLNLYAMRAVLKDLRVSQGERFPVFGFGIPYELLFKYGLLVLVTVQVFFWGHLRSFRLLAAGHLSTVWAPWLPLYPNRLSRVLTIGSSVLFPLAVMFQLLLAAEIHPSSAFFATVGAVTACLLLAEFLRLWQTADAAPRELALPTRQAA
jgi:hypothetical protein